MTERNIDRIIRCRVRYVKETTPEREAQGYINNSFHNIVMKQKGEGLIVKLENDPEKKSRLEFDCYYDFLAEFDIHCRY